MTGAGPPGAATAAGPSAGRPCGEHVASPRYDHVLWVWMENESLPSVVGSSDAPFVTSLAAACGLAVGYQAVTHPSLPNYLAATGGSTFGVTDDAPPSAHPLAGRSIFAQVAAAGLTWRSYAESMSMPCQRDDAGLYAVRHNPAVYYVGLGSSCAAADVPMGPVVGGTLWQDLQGTAFANFAFVIPNVCDDMHNCSVAHGDAWLHSFLTMVFDSPTYRRGHLAVFVVWDEGVQDQNVPALVAAPSVPRGARPAGSFSHYSLLRTAEDLLGLAPLGQAATAPSMVRAFGL